MKHLYPNVAELHAFAASAKYLNFSYAARELGLTPSAVSRQIANLEALFGVKLFVREGAASRSHGRARCITHASSGRCAKSATRRSSC